MKIVFFGTPDYVNPIIKTLDENYDLVETFRSPSDSFESLAQLKPDLIVIASYGKIISGEVLTFPKLGAINIHPSKLPLYRGPSPLQAQILDGVSNSAISYILMDSEMDHGPILEQKDFQISEISTFESLCEKTFLKSAEFLPEVINGFTDGSIKPIEQNHTQATFTKLITKEDGYFDLPADRQVLDLKKLDRMIRAYYPWPTAWTLWNNRIVKLLPEGKIQIEGKKPTDLKSFLNGQPDFPIKNLW